MVNDIANGDDILGERRQDIRAVVEADQREAASGKRVHDLLNVASNAVDAGAAVVVFGPHADGGVNHESDVQVIGADLGVRTLDHGAQADSGHAARHAEQHDKGSHLAGALSAGDPSSQYKVNACQRDQNNARCEHIEPDLRKIRIDGGRCGLGELVLDGLNVREYVLCGESSARPVELAARRLHRCLHFFDIGRVVHQILRIRGIDAEYGHFVKGAHICGLLQGHKRRIEQFRLVVCDKDDDPGPLLLSQLREAEKAGRQALSDGRSSLQLVARGHTVVKRGKDLVQFLVAGSLGIRNIVDRIIFLRILRHEFFLGGEVSLQRVQPAEDEIIVVRHGHILDTGSVKEGDPDAVSVEPGHRLPEGLHEILHAHIVGRGQVDAQTDVPAAEGIFYSIPLVGPRREKSGCHNCQDDAGDGEDPEYSGLDQAAPVERICLEARRVGGPERHLVLGLFLKFKGGKRDRGDQDRREDKRPWIVKA